MAKTTDSVLLQRIAAVESRLAAAELDVLALEEAHAALRLEVTALQAKVDALSDGGSTPPPDDNVYPLIMPADTPVGADVSLGTGPDLLFIAMCNTGTVTPETYCSVAILMDGSAIAVLDVTSTDPDMQNFSIRGAWGPVPHTIGFVSGGKRLGLTNLGLTSVTYNYVPAGLSEDTVLDSRGSVSRAGSLGVWDNTGAPFYFVVPAPAYVPPAPPPPPLVQDLINGQTLQALIDATPSGSTLTLPAGTFHAEAKTQAPITIRGAGQGQTILSGEGGWLANGKGILNAMADLTVEDLTLTKAAVADGNGAGVRGEPGIALVLRNVEVSFCQDGLLAPDAKSVLIDTCNFHDNGAGNEGSGATHEIYVTGNSLLVDMRNSISKCGQLSTHALKSRSKVTKVSDCTLIGNTDDGTNGGATFNTPDGGDVTVTRSRIVRSPIAGNTLLVQHASESIAQGAGTVTLDAVTVEGGGKIISGDFGARLVIGANCVHVGPAPTFEGWGSVEGAFNAG